MGARLVKAALLRHVDVIYDPLGPKTLPYKTGTPMKTARFLLACAAVSVLAACGSQTITSPAAPTRPNADNTSTTNCIKITVQNPDGTSSEQCATDNNGQLGSGL
jgi:uncharacterized lipoprotein YajG